LQQHGRIVYFVIDIRLPLFTSSQDISAHQLNMAQFPQTPTVSGMNNMTIPGQQQFVNMQQSPTSFMYNTNQSFGIPTNIINASTPHAQRTLGSQRAVIMSYYSL